MAAFLFTSWLREVLALVAAGLLLTSRHISSRRMLGLMDWQLLVLFVGRPFAVNHAIEATDAPKRLLAWLATAGLDLVQPS